MIMKPALLASFLSLGLAGFAGAAPAAFDFKDPKGVNGVQFALDSVLEPIVGTASGVTGTVHFDPARPAATTGKIVVAAKSLVVPNATQASHIQGKDWLDTTTHPDITFELVQLADVSTKDNETVATATGKFTLKGVTKQISVPVKLTHLADAMGKRMPGTQGDLLVVRGEFSIKRADYGIQPGQLEDTVNPVIKLTLAIVGSAPKA
jgi:polyisoprenoid-binding protein YceI